MRSSPVFYFNCNYLMRSFLSGGLRFVAARSAYRLVGVGESRWRRFPFVALLFDLPGFGPATFQAHIAAWIGRATKTNLVPGIRVGIVGIHRILHQEHPEARHRHLVPDVLSSRRIAVVDGLKHLVL